MATLRRRLTRFEPLEARRLLAVDLQVEHDSYLPAEPGEEVTRVIRVFNNGEETAEQALIRSSLTDELVDPVWERLSGLLAECPILTIAVLNGTVAGGALGMVLACDLRVAAPGTKFFYPVMKLGVLPQPSDPKRLASLVGLSRAKAMLIGGVKVSADEALQWGLLNQIAGEPMEAARDYAADVLAAKRDHGAAIKTLF